MSKNKFLGAVAAFAFVATGVAAQAQDAQRSDDKRQEAPGADHRPAMAPRPDAGAMKRNDAPKAAEGERRDENGMKRNDAPKAAEGERRDENGMKRNDAPKAAEGERRDENGMKRNDAPKAAEGERRDENGSKMEPKRAAQGERADPDDATRGDKRAGAPGDRQPRAAETDKRNAPDGKRDGKLAERRDAPRINGVKVSSEHAVRIEDALRRGDRFDRPDFDVRIGGRVPESYGIRPLPPEIVEIEPEYRGYDYFIDANDEVVFVSPQTHEIVGTIAYEGRAASIDAPRAARPCPTED